MKAQPNGTRVLRRFVTPALVATLCGFALVAVALQFTSDGEATDFGEAVYAGPQAFKVSGQVTGLWPGARKRIRLRITNPNSFPIRVRSLSVEAGSSNRSGCEARWIKLQKTLYLSLKVRKEGRASVPYPVQLSQSAPNACQAARWPLQFTGSAERVR